MGLSVHDEYFGSAKERNFDQLHSSELRKGAPVPPGYLTYVNPLKRKLLLNNIQNVSSYLAGNRTRLLYKNQLVNAS
jgi:hypothetical protein